MVSLKEALKARVAVYKEAMEEAAKAAVEAAANVAVNAAANAVAEAPPGEPGGSGEPVVIEPDNDESESYDKGAYAAFKEAIKAEDYKAYIEALRFGVDLVRSFFLSFFLTFCQDLLFIAYI